MLARSVSERVPVRRGGAPGPTLARGKKNKSKKKKKSPFKPRRFEPDERPAFDKATYRHATIGHNLFRDADFDPNDPKLGIRNLAVPHRFSWKNIRDSTVRYLNHDESEADFRRWTDRMLVLGYNDKFDQYFDMLTQAEGELQDLYDEGYDQWDDEVTDLDSRIFSIKRLGDHLQASTNRCVAARNALTVTVEAYHDAAAAYSRARGRYRVAVAATKKAKTKPERIKRQATEDAEYASMGRRGKRARHARDDVFADTTEFSKAINNHFANVSDLGPHAGVNNPVRDRLHLNVDESGGMSPFSARMLEMSPHRVSGVGVDQQDMVVGTSGVVADPDDLDPGLRALFDAIGPSRANIQNVPFVFR